jgi:CHAT domain-containing protein
VAPPWLQLLPWSALPSLADRAVTIAPSVAAWFEAAADQVTPDGHVALVAGPRLVHATAEVDELGSAYPEPRVLTGSAATVAATCTALDGAAIAHVAAHGHTNLDNPLFSALELADGLRRTYDLERLRRVPAMFVLSACDSLRGSACGEDLLGMASALLHLGSRAVVGSIAPLPDEAARVLMRRLHDRLAAGHRLADALRRARRDDEGDDLLLSAAAHAVLCMGAA